ncbi:ABC-2 type transport system permease protein [Actinoalloteichus hoggarensis]|uniref:ABC-2 family transporter protein n=1 Tax=Actinoalloteichus hoggarensis TaxID=1470176 RepID=A0A221VYY5_9PSEU|nr:ABC transporter permease [Actinoalloteichus hoggarensis]ASO18762.1 ABC-2 family transporter protein [Actinoalloteichus hoggarensis]MBB5919995.1 ABC-2 type transport system permease protein [Actinoalloteichus hoggarensis]
MTLRAVGALVAANLRRQTRDRMGLFFMVVMPFIAIVFVGLAMGGNSSGSQIPVGVVAQNPDSTGEAILAELRNNPSLAVEEVDSPDALADSVRQGSVAAGLVIPTGSTELDLILTQMNGTGMAARSAIDASIGKVAGVLEATRAATTAGSTPEQAAADVRAAQEEAVSVSVRTSGSGDGTPTGFAYTAPANLLLFTFINSMAVAAALVESRRLGMTRRTLAAPVTQRAVLLGEAVSRLVVAVAQALLITVISTLMFGIDWGDPLAVVAIVGAFCLVATGAAMLVGSLAKSSSHPPAIGPPIGIILGMLGGCFWPREVAPDALNAVGYVFPHAWAMDALLTLTTPGTGVGQVVLELGVLLGMAVAMMVVAIVVFRRRNLVVS